MPQLTLASEFPKATEDDWRERVAATLKGRSFDSLVTETLDGIRLQPLYQGPGEPAPVPRRGVAEPPWTIMQRVDIPDLARANAQALEDVENGAGGLVLVWPGSVSAGAHGVAVSTPRDLERLTKGIDIDPVALRLDAGGFGSEAVRLVLDFYAARNLDLARCDVAFGLDPLGAFALTGRAADVAELKRELADTVREIAGRGHGGPAMMVDTRVYHGGGASEAQELAAGLATAIEYVRWLEAKGHHLDDAARRIGFVLTGDADQFLTIAKLRAARLLWGRALGAMGLAPEPAVVHVETAMRMMSRHDSHVNLLRTTTAALAAGIGGADAVTALAFTAALGLPDGFARRLARTLQVMLQEESGIGRVGDAGAGSGLVEAATRELAAAAWGEFQAIEAQGGMAAGLESGFVQGRIAQAARARRQAVAERRFGLTGVSRFPRLGEVVMEVLDVPLSDTWRVARGEDTMVCAPLAQERAAQPFEALRDAADLVFRRSGERPAVFLANLGPMAEHDARARWARDLFAAGGIAALADDGFDSPEAAAEAFRASGAQVACLCGSERGYGELGAAAAEALRQSGAVRVYMAGRPGEIDGAGVDEYLYDGINAVAALERLHGVLDP